MFKRFIVPLDGSNLAEQALEFAIPLVREANGVLILAKAPLAEQRLAPSPTPVGTYYLEMSTEQTYREAEEYLREKAIKLASEGIPTQYLIPDGLTPIAERIASAADEVDADVIVMTSHGYTGMRKLILGSVAEGVLKYASCPVLIVTAQTLAKQKAAATVEEVSVSA